jgi:hypothetical protein
MKVKFTKGIPQNPGKYLMKTQFNIELITVETNKQDLRIIEYPNHHIDSFKNSWFSEKIEEEELTKFPEDINIKA